MRKYLILSTAVFLLLTFSIGAFQYIRGERLRKEETREATLCLRDADCQSRLEAAVNSIYSEIGYDRVYTVP